MSSIIQFLKHDFRNTAPYFFKVKPKRLKAHLFVINSTAQSTTSDFFVYESSPMVGLEKNHLTVLITQKTFFLDSISATCEHVSNENEEIANVQSIEKQFKIQIIEHFNKPKTRTTQTSTQSVVFKNHKDQQKSGVFGKENPTFCSTNTTQQLNKKFKIIVCLSNLCLAFKTKKTFLYFLNLDFGFQQVNYKLFFLAVHHLLFSVKLKILKI